MTQKRKDYRKKIAAGGQLYIGGEILLFHCYDVSVNGLKVELEAGAFLSTLDDFNALLLDDDRAQVFVEELMLGGEVRVAWVREDLGKIVMGLEFEAIVRNAEKLWLKRRGYRKTEPFSAILFVGHDRLRVEGINRSQDGLCVKLDVQHPGIKENAPVKLQILESGLAAVGKVVWMSPDGDSMRAGLQILPLA